MKKHSDKYVPVALIDLYALLANVTRGAEDPNVGFEDAMRTMSELKGIMNKTSYIPIEIAESALWSSNLLNEQGKFVHPEGISFGALVARILPPGYTFDQFYNMMVPEGDKDA